MRRSARTTAVLLLTAALVALAPTLWLQVGASGHLHTTADAPARPVTLVLGAAAWDGHPSPFLADRLDVAATLYRTGRTQVIVVSGDGRTPGYDEPSTMRDYLVAHGVPGERIVRDDDGTDTYDSCARARRIFGVRELLVVSQTYHLPRAVTVCRGLGVAAEGVGETAMSRYAQAWRAGQLREVAAAWKALIDVALARDARAGPPDDAVHRALRTPGT